MSGGAQVGYDGTDRATLAKPYKTSDGFRSSEIHLALPDILCEKGNWSMQSGHDGLLHPC